MTLSGVTRRGAARVWRISSAGSLRIGTFEGSRPVFGRAIAYWVFNRDRDTELRNRATEDSVASQSPCQMIHAAGVRRISGFVVC
jgi:hypothetical protein